MSQSRRKSVSVAKPTFDPDREPYLIGYARVSMADQNPQLQIDALVKAGVPRDRIYQEQASGVAKNRPQFELMMKDAREGDVVVVWKLDRLGRNVRQVLDTFHELTQKGAGVRVITQPGMDTTTAMGRLIITIMAAVAEMERELIRERTIAGLKVAREAGRIGGRVSKITDEDVLAMQHLSPRSAMKRTGLTRTGWLRRLEMARKRAAEKPV
jgi:DNA invertase Pin-like site-specific DNA recombinase